MTVTDVEGYGAAVEARDWFEIRRSYEQQGRRRPAGAPKLVILVHSASHRDPRDLPYDIEQASEVVRVRVPVPPEYRQFVVDLPDDLSARAVRVIRGQSRDPIGAVVAELWGVVLPGDADPTRELEVLVRLRSDPTVPPSVWTLLEGRFRTPLGRSLSREPADPSPLQLAWENFLDRGSESSWAETLGGVGPRLGSLFHAGLLQPARRRAHSLPDWTTLGSTEATARDRLAELLPSRPEPWPPLDVGDWVRQAEWWAEVRATLAEAGASALDLASDVWQIWEELDRAFGSWLQREFGPLMVRSAAMPLTVDKIAAFLARRLRAGEAERVLLVVVDGMGLPQLATIRRAVGLRTVTSGASFAMVPTLTPVSRQAVFAGRLPLSFPETLRTTDAEEARWKAFWEEEGVDVSGVRYIRTAGVTSANVPPLEKVPVIGLVVQAVDEMLHGAHVLGDAQAAAAIQTWATHGFLRTLVEQAEEQDYEVWLTSDHGNIEALPLGKVQEGLAVESAGSRVRWYPNPALRDGARADGTVWDPPGLPEGVCYPLFAPGRGGYFSGEVRVTHGGFSLDEAIVPFTRVTT